MSTTEKDDGSSMFDVLLRASRRYHVRIWGRIHTHGVFDGKRDWDSPPESFFTRMEDAYDECARVNLTEVLRVICREHERVERAVSDLQRAGGALDGFTAVQLAALAIMREGDLGRKS